MRIFTHVPSAYMKISEHELVETLGDLDVPVDMSGNLDV
jgi:hypothetical protein